MMPLAFSIRPKTIDEIIGQKQLIGEKGVIRKLLNNKKIPSLILYGEPGTGKTTLALCIVNQLEAEYKTFNASTDNKALLKNIIDDSDKQIHLIIDEIHRMKKDIQDYLLPFVESGKVILIGITTVNPYHSVNPAIRSRCNILKLQPLTHEELTLLYNRVNDYIKPKYTLSENSINYLINCSNGEARTLINMIELISLSITGDDINTTSTIELDYIKNIINKPAIDFDKNGDSYYETLSGLHKSIRGSDVNASLHYLAKLIYADDLTSLIRRLYCIAYEDISLANPSIGPKVKAACEAALELGMPEGRIPLASIVVEMALSPKSNSTYLALSKAMEDIENGKSGHLPFHLKNTYSFDGNHDSYKYPHDYPGGWVNQQYLPDTLKDAIYYVPKTTSKYEEALKERYDAINLAKAKYNNKKTQK